MWAGKRADCRPGPFRLQAVTHSAEAVVARTCVYHHITTYSTIAYVLPRLATAREESPMAGPGSGGNVLAALCSFFIPGLGQLLQGRLGMAIVHFVLAGILWFFFLGWLIHLWSIIDAARYTPPQQAT